MFALLFNGTVSALGTSWKLNSLLDKMPDDAVLMCTGNTVKWISELSLIETGEVVFLDIQEDTIQPHQIDCQTLYVSDLYADSIEIPFLVDQHLVAKSFLSRLAQRPYTAYPFQTALSRAPPFTSKQKF